MKKSRSIILISIIALAAIIPARVHPCTSFADYSASPVYGLNFDSLDHDLRFNFYEGKGFDLLAFEFFEDNQWIRMAHFTTKGMHNAGLLLYPPRVAVPKKTETDVSLYEIGAWMYELPTIGEFRARIDQVRFHEGAVRSHNVIYGPEYALFCEASPDGNYIQQSEPKGFLVLTNFEMKKFHGKPPEKVYGVGDSRYRAALRSIKAIRDSATMNGDAAMGVLRDAVADAGDMKTRCSMVFLPNDQTLTLAFGRNFDKRYVISLKDRTVTAAWPGANKEPVRIGKKGVSKGDLLTWANADPADDWKGTPDFPVARVLLLAVAGGCVLVTVLSIIRLIKRRKSAAGSSHRD